MIVKSSILKHRVRKILKSFSEADHRLLRNGYIELSSHPEVTLYLFLVCVADNKGLSYYGDKSIMSKLLMNQRMLQNARSGLIKNNCLAYANLSDFLS